MQLISNLDREEAQDLASAFPELFGNNPPITNPQAFTTVSPEVLAPTEMVDNTVEDVELEIVTEESSQIDSPEEVVNEFVTPEESLEEELVDDEEEEEEEVEEAIVVPVPAPRVATVDLAEVSVNQTRFKGADWFSQVKAQDIILAGLGGIGSYVNFALSRLGPKRIFLFDDDTFEDHNMSGQLVGMDSIGLPKVEVAAEVAENYSNYLSTYTYNAKYQEDSITAPVMICGFDNMEARKTFYNRWKSSIIKGGEEEFLFIDGRLLAEEYQILCIKGDDTFAQKEYEDKFLFSDDAVEEVDCTLKQTSHMAMAIASQMTSYFINFCNNLSEGFPRRIPYYTSYNSPMNVYEFKY